MPVRMSRVVVRVMCAIAVRDRERVIVAVEVVEGEPAVGRRLTIPSGEAIWEIAGFGHAPPSDRQGRPEIDLLLKPVGGDRELAEGDVLSEARPVDS